MSADLLRNVSLLGPLLAVAAALVVRHRHGSLRPRVPGAVLATLLAWTGILAVETAGHWWHVATGPTTVLGLPLETSLGWALAWGALPALAGGRPVLWGLGLMWSDVLLVPHFHPLVVLGDDWLVGEAVLLACVATPVLTLGRLTTTRRLLGVRVVLQGLTFTGLFGWLAPTLALAHDGLGWADVVDHGPLVRTLLLAGGVVLAVPALAAVAELWRVGHGTPFPWDPPDRLVTTGPYAYLHNPMQASVVGLLVLLASAAGSPSLVLGVAVATAFALAVADPHEHATLAERWPGYAAYRRSVRGWVPRSQPGGLPPGTLWVSETCGLCRSLGRAVVGLGPRRLTVRPAEDAGVRLVRIRWAGPGTYDSGVAALARALEAVGLGWAWVGWLVRLPLVTPVVQAVADACGLGPRELPGPVRTVSP